MKNICITYRLFAVVAIIIRFFGYINSNMHLINQKIMRNNPFFDANTPLPSQKMKGVCSMMYFLFFVYFAKLLRNSADFGVESSSGIAERNSSRMRSVFSME